MSGYHGSKLSGSQQSFLTETAICIVEQWKKSTCMSHRFVPECNRAQESHKCYVFCHNCRTMVGCDPETLATKAT